MNEKIFIGIPTVNRADLLNVALEHYAVKYPEAHFIIVDNGNQNINMRGLSHTIIRPGKNIGVAASWNTIMKIAINVYGAYGVFMWNDDIVMDTHVSYLKAIQETCIDTPLFVVCEKVYHWSSFYLCGQIFISVGPFNEIFYPAYFEDNDYFQRIKADSFFVVPNPLLNPAQYKNSASIEKNPYLNKDFMLNRKRYVKIWGGLPGAETKTYTEAYPDGIKASNSIF